MIDIGWLAALRSAVVGEFFWTSGAAAPRAMPGTPLVFDGRPALAFPYADVALARDLGSAPACVLTLSDRRMAGRAWRPLALHGTPRLIEDADGTVFCEHLLTQELVKFPPSRALADSLLLRREHWWYLPRLLVILDDVRALPLAERAGGTADGVLGVHADDGEVRVASVARTADGRVHAIDGALPPGREAVLLQHDVSVPDLERWPRAVARGTVDDGAFTPTDPLPDVRLPRPLGLLTRMLRQRDLARGCRRELARRERRPSPR